MQTVPYTIWVNRVFNPEYYFIASVHNNTYSKEWVRSFMNMWCGLIVVPRSAVALRSKERLNEQWKKKSYQILQ